MTNSPIGIRFRDDVLRALDNYADQGGVSRSEAVNSLLSNVLAVKQTATPKQSGQNRDTGAAGNDFGRKTAPEIATHLGAKAVSTNANEFELNGRLINIKCAKKKTRSVGVTYKILERVSGVVAAFESDDGSFDLYELTPEIYRKYMRATASKGPAAGRVGIVSSSVFHREGKKLGRVHLS